MKDMKKPYVYIYGTGWGSIVAELLSEQGYKVNSKHYLFNVLYINYLAYCSKEHLKKRDICLNNLYRE